MSFPFKKKKKFNFDQNFEPNRICTALFSLRNSVITYNLIYWKQNLELSVFYEEKCYIVEDLNL